MQSLIQEIRQRVHNLTETTKAKKELRNNGTRTYYNLSSYLTKRDEFMVFAKMIYLAIRDNGKDYPNYFKWYWKKQILRVIDGTGEIITCVINNKIVGAILLKKDEEERKICSLYVAEKHRGIHIGTELFNRAFDYLETTKPLITIADYQVPYFKSIIKKYGKWYGWKLNQITNNGYYNEGHCEYVYNGKLQK